MMHQNNVFSNSVGHIFIATGYKKSLQIPKG